MWYLGNVGAPDDTDASQVRSKYTNTYGFRAVRSRAKRERIGWRTSAKTDSHFAVSSFSVQSDILIIWYRYAFLPAY